MSKYLDAEVILEGGRIADLMEEVVEICGPVMGKVPRESNNWFIREKLYGRNNMFKDTQDFCGERAKVTMVVGGQPVEMEGIIVATRKVGELDLLGIEFKDIIKDGCQFFFRHWGIQGRNGCGMWFLPKDVTVMWEDTIQDGGEG